MKNSDEKNVNVKPLSLNVKPLSLMVALTAICAVLYAVGSYLTAYIPSPWGSGQFRPAVVIPSFFAVISGPIPAGVGSALGTLIADSVKHGGLYEGSLFAAVPGNFLGFYLFGYIVRRKFTWSRFVLASNITLTLANLLVAALYVSVFKILYLGDPKYLAFSSPALLAFIIGLTIWWFVTMLPFVLLVTPSLIRIASQAFPSLVPEDVRVHSLREELPYKTFSLALLVPGLIMVGVGLAMSFTVLGDQMVAFFKEPTAMLVQLMFYMSGITLSIIGILFRLRNVVKK